MSDQPKIKVGVSSCLLGEKVRHDGGAKRSRYITDVMAEYIDFIPTCPEVDIGLGVPRPTIHLEGNKHDPRLVVVRDPSQDLTQKMQNYSDQKIKEMNAFCGYIFKKNSPSCGPWQVKVYQEKNRPPKQGVGIFAKTFMEKYPNIPVEDEGRLNDAALRENFIERVYVMHRWQQFLKEGLTAKGLVEFHSRHKLALMSHNVSAYKRIGQLVSDLKKNKLSDIADEYIEEMMRAFKYVATTPKRANVLIHCYGYLKRSLSSIDKEELLGEIEKFRQNQVPLIVPITLLRHHFLHYPDEYIAKQTFLSPYPDELMLRNRI